MKDVAELKGLFDGLSVPMRRRTSEDDGVSGDRLKALCKSLTEKPTPFAVGQLIQWKEGLRHKKWPDYGKPAVVTKILPETIIATAESGTPYFREPLDIVFAIMADGDFIEFHGDSRRFKLYEGESGEGSTR
jgi:hypothetical protein